MSDSKNNTTTDKPRPQITPEQLQQLLRMQAAMKQKQALSPRQAMVQKFFTGFVARSQKFIHLMDRFINFVTKPQDNERNDVVQAARSPILFGTLVIIVFIGFGGIWAATAPLDSAAVAIGTVISDTNRKTIQNQLSEATVIKKIYVKQGDHVKEGDPLVELEDSKIKANYESILSRYRNALANESRLIAERDKLDSIKFPEFLINDIHDKEVEKIISTQEKLFRSAEDIKRSENDSLKQKLLQLHKKLESLEARKVSSAKTLEILSSRLEAMKPLLDKGFLQKNAFLELEAKEANAKSELIATENEIASTNQEVTKTDIEILNLESKYTAKTLSDLRDTQGQVTEAREQFYTLKDSLNKVIIKSPVDGVVNVVRIHTIGGVVGPGNAIMEISPINDTLIVEAKVPHKNIDSIHAGLNAKMRFSAFKSRISPVFPGTVVSLSPDVVAQEQGQQMDPGGPYYIARIEIDMDEFNRLTKGKNLSLQPGMQAEVQIVTGTRTLLRYLLDPVLDVMFKSFKEK